jgi:hypothetical protein
MTPMRLAKTAEELEALLVEGILTASPVVDEISTSEARPCGERAGLIELAQQPASRR